MKSFRHLGEGVVTFLVGLGLFLFTDGVETPVVTLTKVGVVLMVVGGGTTAVTVARSLRGSRALGGR
ncbi:DUF5708 family protein [Streptomyces sp. NPDC002454]|uniref:DUF5708 family protein n=1 Tax=unclassified Streptomyces TaxID=2593676 RepID=UPI00332C79C4